MGEGFRRFKNRAHLYSILLSLSLGFGVGGLLCGALILSYKQQWLAIAPLWCVLLGVGLMLLVGSAAFFLTRASECRLAGALDRELGLNERVKTMVAFSDGEGEMLDLQREDTEKKLSEIPARRLRFRSLWVSVVSVFLGLCMLISAFAIPAKAAPPPYDPDFNMDTWQQTALKDLIRWVENSSMEQKVKGPTLNYLDKLLEELYEAEKLSQMKESVLGAIVAIDSLVDRANTYAAIRGELEGEGDEKASLLATAIGALGTSAEEEVFVELRDVLGYDELEPRAEELSSFVLKAIEDSRAEENDLLSLALKKLASGVLAAATLSDGSSNDETDLLLEGVFMTAASEINGALRQQSTNRSGSNYVIARLQDIFEIPSDEVPDLGSNDLPEGTGDFGSGSEEDDDDEKLPSDGGLGSGDTVWGSDDVIYCPSDNSYKPYGDMLIEYQAKILADIQDGKYSEEFAEMLLEYLDTLSSGIVAE